MKKFPFSHWQLYSSDSYLTLSSLSYFRAHLYSKTLKLPPAFWRHSYSESTGAACAISLKIRRLFIKKLPFSHRQFWTAAFYCHLWAASVPVSALKRFNHLPLFQRRFHSETTGAACAISLKIGCLFNEKFPFPYRKFYSLCSHLSVPF